MLFAVAAFLVAGRGTASAPAQALLGSGRVRGQGIAQSQGERMDLKGAHTVDR